jgi:hypothetical protein
MNSCDARQQEARRNSAVARQRRSICGTFLVEEHQGGLRLGTKVDCLSRDVFGISDILLETDVNSSGLKRKPKIPSYREGQYHIRSGAEEYLLGGTSNARAAVHNRVAG